MRRMLFLLLFLILPSFLWAATAYVKHDVDRNTVLNHQVHTRTFAGGVTNTGDTMGGTIWWIPVSVAISSVTVCGNTATVVNDTTIGTSLRSINFYYPNVTAGACDIVATWAASTVTDDRMIIHEISGVDTTTPLDSGNKSACSGQSLPGTGPDVVTSGSITTTVNGDYILGSTSATGGGATVTAGTGYTIRANVATRNSEDQVQSTAGAIAATFTPSANEIWITCVMAFQPSGGGGASPTFFQRRLQQ